MARIDHSMIVFGASGCRLTERPVTLSRMFLCAALLFSSGVAVAAGCHPQLYSNVGCHFYAVTLPNPIAYQAEQFNTAEYDYAVGLQNASSSIASSVTISGGALIAPQTTQLAGGTSQTIVLPKVDSLWQSSTTQVITNGAYYISASSPITAVQYNTIDPASGSNDASLLVPIENAGTSFRTVSWPSADLGGTIYPAQLGIVAMRSGTTVQIQASSAVFAPGAGLTATGGTIVLNKGDVVLLANANSDSSGTLITSDAPILVWSSHSGAQIPDGTLAADFMEETLPPISALGTDYIIARPIKPPGASGNAQQYVKFVGTADNTSLSFNPSIAGAPATLQAGQTVTVTATQDFRVQSDKKIVVAQFMVSAGVYGGDDTDGDPSQTIAVPTAQAQTSVGFYAPQVFNPNYAQIIAPVGASVTIDGTAVSGWVSVGSSGYAVANYLLCCTDAHQANGNHPFLLSVYSYPPNFTSYWYPAAFGIADDIFADGFN